MHAASALFKQHFCTLLHFCWNTRTCEVAIIEQQNVLAETPPEMPFIINLSPATSKKEHRSDLECIPLECCISILLKMSKTFFSVSIKKNNNTVVYIIAWEGKALCWYDGEVGKVYPLGAVGKLLGKLYCLFAWRDLSVKQGSNQTKKKCCIKLMKKVNIKSNRVERPWNEQRHGSRKWVWQDCSFWHEMEIYFKACYWSNCEPLITVFLFIYLLFFLPRLQNVITRYR